MKKDWRPEDARREILRLCHAGLDPITFRMKVAAQLRRAIPFDAWCWPTADPATGLVTGAVGEDIPPGKTQRFFEIEYMEPDFTKFGDLARQRGHVGALSRATDGRLDRSLRYREIFGPAGIGEDLRAALVIEGSTWGYLALHRDESAPFDDFEAAYLGQLVLHLAEGLRTSLLLRTVEHSADEEAPGIVLLDAELRVASISSAGERWLADIVSKQPMADGSLPDPVAAVIANLLRLERDHGEGAAVPRARVPTRSGRWLVVHATRLSDPNASDRAADPATDWIGPIAIVLEPAHPHELMPLLLEAYALTKRESQITQLVLLGRATNRIAADLGISPLTVQQHLKGVFEKVGVHSKRELAAGIFARHYWPRVATGAALSADGAFQDGPAEA